MKRILLLAALASACGGEQSRAPDPAPAPVVETTLPAEPVEAATDAGAAAPRADDCVAECVAARQMQATSPEQIQRDCEARCSE
jgi:hypothetical protein